MQSGQNPQNESPWETTAQPNALPTQVLRGEVPLPAQNQNFAPYQTNQPMMSVIPPTSATAALVISLVSVVGGLLIGLPFLMAPISLIMANKALAITKSIPNHPDHATARAAQVISAIVTTLMAVVLLLIGGVIILLMLAGF